MNSERSRNWSFERVLSQKRKVNEGVSSTEEGVEGRWGRGGRDLGKGGKRRRTMEGQPQECSKVCFEESVLPRDR